MTVFLMPRWIQRSKITLCGGRVSLTMAQMQEDNWIPRLIWLAKCLIKQCNGSKQFHMIAFASVAPGNLPRDKTEGTTCFQVMEVNYTWPIQYHRKAKGKAYSILYACSQTRGLYLELARTMETGEFLGSPRLIARHGCPEKIYSDNGTTFEGVAKWLRQVMRDDRLNNFLAETNIRWQFNLSRAPWWGGQIERMVRLMKRAPHKTKCQIPAETERFPLNTSRL